MGQLLTAREVDRVLQYPRGRSLKLAKARKLPHIVLPDGEVRFDEEQIDALLQQSAVAIAEDAKGVAHVG